MKVLKHLPKPGAASPHSSPEPRTHSPGCPRGQCEFGTGASQLGLRHPAKSITWHRNEEDNSQHSSGVHAGACLQVEAE